VSRGEAEWISLASAGHDLLITAKKAKFIEEQLPKLIGTDAFWMDVICIDQRNTEAVLEAAKLSPEIFGNATRTIAIKAGDGFFDCCARSVSDTQRYRDFRQSLLSHVSDHWKTKFKESYLRRVWTVQEIIWSNDVQFVSDHQRKLDPKVC